MTTSDAPLDRLDGLLTAAEPALSDAEIEAFETALTTLREADDEPPAPHWNWSFGSAEDGHYILEGRTAEQRLQLRLTDPDVRFLHSATGDAVDAMEDES
ncbi:hypothetical protein [Haloglomus halophilum]|uniref:hypothetical protein n=1 Tax=Haloglomus halophilum TaxID=2962672 RepID=UPI0020C9BA84|nr:hypothetical protein [Haloglomus halophilum]